MHDELLSDMTSHQRLHTEMSWPTDAPLIPNVDVSLPSLNAGHSMQAI